jgi:hypothetical protein
MFSIVNCCSFYVHSVNKIVYNLLIYIINIDMYGRRNTSPQLDCIIPVVQCAEA